MEGAHRPNLLRRSARRATRATHRVCRRRTRGVGERRSVQAHRGRRRCGQCRTGAWAHEGRDQCKIKGVGPVPVTTARALLDDAAVTVMIREGDDITAVSSPKRTIPVKVRRALEARYPTCGVPACANDEFLEIDHIVALEDHGPTELDNLWRLCSHHHRLKTYGGWMVVGQNGDRDLVPPDDPDPP